MIEILSLRPRTGTGSPSSSRAAAATAAEGSGGGPRLAGGVPQCRPPVHLFPLCFSPLWKWVLCPCGSSILWVCASCCQRKISHLQGTRNPEGHETAVLILEARSVTSPGTPSQRCPSPSKMSSLLSLLHWDTEELSKIDLGLPNRKEFLGQSGVTPASLTFSPTGMRRMEKFIPQFTPMAKKTTHSPVLCGQNNIWKKD